MSQNRLVNHQTLRIFWRTSLNYPSLALASLLHTAGAFFSSIAIPYFASKSLAAAVMPGDSFYKELSLLVISVLLAIAANRIGFNSAMKLIAQVMHDLQNKVMNTLMQRSMRFHVNIVSGKLVSDALDYVGSFNMLFNTIFMQGLSLFLTIITGLILVSVNSWQLGLYLLAVVIVTLTWAYTESRARSGLRGRRLAATKLLTSHLSDSIVNAQTVKTFAAEQREIDENAKLSRDLRDMRINDWQRAGSSGNNRIAFLLFALVGLLLVFHVMNQYSVSLLGTGIFAFTYTLTLIMRLFDINTLTRQTEEAFLQASPMTQIILEENEVKDDVNAKKLLVTAGAVDFRDVRFSYQENQKQEDIFSSLNLHINPGEHIGLVGPSGGGKTTITRLLLRFEDIQGGVISVDDQAIKGVTQVSLRDAIGYVPQEPLLFHRSIRENIAYGRPSATDEEIHHAAKLAYSHEFISKLPNGYDTIVGERGVKLSGGQRQRIAIARAILKSAPVLVLDEATSALDSESEKLIQSALQELLDGRTAIIIAHRLSTIQRLDRIVVLDEGNIVEEGTHKELLANKGLYAKLWSHQSGGFIEE